LFSITWEEPDIGDDEVEAIEKFDEGIRQGFLDASAWLSARDPALIDELRARGIGFDLFIGGWISDLQFDLDLPAELLLECGRRGLAIRVCTND